MATVDQTTQNLEEIIEQLNNKKNNNIFTIREHDKQHTQSVTTSHMRAEGSATFEDFIEWINRIVSRVLKNYKVEFSPDEGSKTKVSSTNTLDHPHIQFSIKSRKPKNSFYAKPRIMEDFTEESINRCSERKGSVYSQIFDYVIQFDILASDYRTANAVMYAFEDAMFNYTAFFKKNGISEILFLQQYTDSNQDTYRNTVSVRSLQYVVSVERKRLQYDSTVSIISSSGED